MTTPSTAADLAARLAADARDLAAADLVTLQAFQGQADSATFTVQGFVDAIGALEAQLGDTDRQAIVRNLHGQLVNNLAQFAEMVGSTARMAAAADPGAGA